MVAKGGAKLVDEDAINFLKKNLIQKVNLLTPNIPEAEVLTGVKIKNREDMILSAKKVN